MTALTSALGDGRVIVKRNLIKIIRVPEILLFTCIQPVMFVLLFAYIFGSTVNLPGTSYREFLIAGIFVQTTVFGATFTGASLAQDMQKGILDRFRSLPMSSAAVLIGRTVSDVAINALSLLVMAMTGLLVGWRIRSSVLDAVAGFALLLLFAYAFSWIMALIGLIVPSPEVVQNASFLVLFPLTFIANTFVPLETLPTVLRVFAEWNPVSAVAQATRQLFGNSSGVLQVSGAWPISHPVLYTLIWVVALLAIFVPLSVRQYQRAAAR
ncbi:MAG: ABC transporter permease [Mycobacteriales bacterium]